MTTRARLPNAPALALLACALLAALVAQGCSSAHGTTDTPAAQLRFGVSMAEKGLWSEAFFRFEQAHRMSGGSDAQVLNNLAVASEALGKFDDALGYYKQALQLAPGDAALKNNYDRFLSFYESFRARGDEKHAPVAGGAPAAPAADNGTPGNPAAPATPMPGNVPGTPGAGEPPGTPHGPVGTGPGTAPPAGPGGEPVPEPLPTPPHG